MVPGLMACSENLFCKTKLAGRGVCGKGCENPLKRRKIFVKRLGKPLHVLMILPDQAYFICCWLNQLPEGTMGALIDVVEEYLIEIGWKFEKDDEKDLLTVYVAQDNNVPENKRLLLAEFITRANYGLNLGNFDMDMDDGELGYKVSADLEGGTLSRDMVGNMVGAGVSTMDQYYPGLMAVLFSNATPEEAIIQIERPPITH